MDQKDFLHNLLWSEKFAKKDSKKGSFIPKQVEELASDNASAAMFDLSKQLIFKDMSDAEKSKSAEAGAVKCQLFSLFGYNDQVKLRQKSIQ